MALRPHATRVVMLPRAHQQFDYIDPRKWLPYIGPRRAIPARVNNHVNQYTSWHTCMEAIEELEKEDQAEYHAVVRIRDNSIVLEEIDLHLAYIMSGFVPRNNTRSDFEEVKADATQRFMSEDCMRPPKVVTKDCATWGGISDKNGMKWIVMERKMEWNARKGTIRKGRETK
eukprot:scaffold141688_cov44-Prasinocladus_malaysianus.AAC.1